MRGNKKWITMTIGVFLSVHTTYGQGTKLSQFPMATLADMNTTLVGVQNVSGTYVDHRYSMTQLAAYMNAVITLDQALHNGNETGRAARFTDGSSNITDIDHGNIQLAGAGYHADLHPGTMTVYNAAGGYTQLAVGSDPSLGISSASGSHVGYMRSAGITADRIWRMPDSSGTLALLQNLTFLSSTLTSGKIFVGNVSNVSTAVNVSGDATLSNTGVLVVDSAKFATRLRVQKAIDSLNGLSRVTSVGTGYGLLGGTITSSGTILADTSSITTRGRTQKLTDSVMRILTSQPTSATSYTTSVTITSGIASDASIVWRNITALSGNLLFNNPTGSWADHQILVVRIRDNGTARTLSYGTKFRSGTLALQLSTVTGQTLYEQFVYNSDEDYFDLTGWSYNQ